MAAWSPTYRTKSSDTPLASRLRTALLKIDDRSTTHPSPACEDGYRTRRPRAMASNENLSQRGFVLNNGSGEIPALGFGTSLSDNRKTRNAVKTAVEVGFRHLDAAERYRNEAQVGTALAELFANETVRREDLFVTTKLWNNNHRPERVKPAF